MHIDEHVRVDVFYNKFSERNKKLVNLFGNLLFLIPFSIIISYTSIPFVEDSYNILESKPQSGGLPYRFLIKSMITLSFFLLSAIGIIRIINSIKGSE